MTLKAVAQIQPDSHEDFIRKVILWYRDKRKRWRNAETYAYGGNGHLGVTLEELKVPFNRHFGIPGPDVSYTIKDMIEKGTLVLALRRYEDKGERRSYDRGRKLAEIRLLQELPKGRARGRLRLYLPDTMPREVVSMHRKIAEADKLIREILHPAPTAAA